MSGLVAWVQAWTEPRSSDPMAVRCVRRLITADARDRVFILAGQAFIAVIPLTILIASFVSGSGSDEVGDFVISRLSLRGEAARDVRVLFAQPSQAAGAVSIVGVLVLLISVNSFSRSIRRTLEVAWQLPASGAKGARDGFVGVLTIVAMTILLGALSILATESIILEAVVAVPQLAIGGLAWLLAQYLLLGRRIALSALIPGAMAGAVAQLLAGKLSSLWMPYLIASNAERYGLIGISFSLVTWLIISAAVMVCVAIVGAEVGRAPTDGGSAGFEPAM